MYCFRCNLKSKVLYTATDNNKIYRQRQCFGCGRTWYTEEVEDSSPRVAGALNRLRSGIARRRKVEGAYTKVCLVCGTEYKTNRMDSTTCTYDCYVVRNRQLAKERYYKLKAKKGEACE